MNWIRLDSQASLEAAWQLAEQQPIALFKHSTRCAISSMALARLERRWAFEPGQLQPYFLDLLAHRDLSQAIADKTGVWHQSPQLIVYYRGAVLYEASHSEIEPEEIEL